jgi:hypothetical protein
MDLALKLQAEEQAAAASAAAASAAAAAPPRFPAFAPPAPYGRNQRGGYGYRGMARPHSHLSLRAVMNLLMPDMAAFDGGGGEDNGDDYEANWALAERLGSVVSKGAPRGAIVDLPTRRITSSDLSGSSSSSSARFDSSRSSCAVCLSDYEAGEEVRTLPCVHFFHTGCIDPWLVKNGVCPVCKHPISHSQR